jgi:hypothetical protein
VTPKNGPFLERLRLASIPLPKVRRSPASNALNRGAELALASTTARKRHSRHLANLLRPPPPRRNCSELQRSASREFAQQKLHEEQQPAEADAAEASKRNKCFVHPAETDAPLP